MDDTVQDDDEPILGTSTLRGILLLGGVAAVAYVAYQFWYKQRALEMSSPAKRTPVIRVPIQLPIANQKARK